MGSFETILSNEVGHARRGIIHTDHGDVQTPAFFPVVSFIGGPTPKSGGIWSRTRNRLFGEPEFQGAMFQTMSFLDFNLTPESLKNYWRKKSIRERFTDHEPPRSQYDKPADFTQPLFVDSGGFKLMNSDTFGDPPEEGGDDNDWGIYTNPESILDLQLDYGADIIATLDYPIPPNLNEEETVQRMEDSIDSAIRCLELLEEREESPAVYIAIHGHDYETINWYVGNFLERAQHIDKSFEGFAIGSLVPLRNNVETLVDIIQGANDAIPEDQEDDIGLHVFGVGGKFTSLLTLLGADSFDSSSYIRAAQFKKVIDREIRPKEHGLDDYEGGVDGLGDIDRHNSWSKFTADEFKTRDEWNCRCPACQELNDVGIDQMYETLYESESYDRSGDYMKSDFYAMIAYHNFHVYQDEMNYVRSCVEEEGGDTLLEYVAKLATNGVGKLEKALRRAQHRDPSLTHNLRKLGYDELTPQQKSLKSYTEGTEETKDDEPTISLEHTPDDFNVLTRDDYEIGDDRVLLVIPCSQKKPYSDSRTHRVVQDAVSKWTDDVHKVTVSGMYGPVPEMFEDISAVKSYEYVLSNAEKDRQELVKNRLVDYLEEHGEEFDVIVGYATSKTYREVIQSAFVEYGSGIVLPTNPERRALTEHFRKTNLEELSEYLAEELSPSPPQ